MGAEFLTVTEERYKPGEAAKEYIVWCWIGIEATDVNS